MEQQPSVAQFCAMTRDTGNYCGPVPQYVTNNATQGRYLVRQKSHVTMQNP
jgi:hypothetical protein